MGVNDAKAYICVYVCQGVARIDNTQGDSWRRGKESHKGHMNDKSKTRCKSFLKKQKMRGGEGIMVKGIRGVRNRTTRD